MNTNDKPARLTVRELQAILADCDPDAPVSLYIPMFIDESDKTILADPGALTGEHGYSPEVSASFQTSKEVPYETFFDENGHARDGVKPNCVSIALSENDRDRLIASRQRAIENPDESDGMEPEPIIADTETVVIDVRIRRDVHTSIRTLLRSVNASHQVKTEQACTHGLLTVAGALEMLAEDLGMVETRPGSWEGSNMAQVLRSHGYSY